MTALNLFQKSFGREPSQIMETPGRVNIIGEHTDYNGGMVLPTALPLGVTVAFSPRKDNLIRIASHRFDDIAELDLENAEGPDWTQYAAGAIIYANKTGLINKSADIAIHSTLPDGAGLSSSAALIVGILKAARQETKAPMSDREIAQLARRVENEFIGVPCGIMDQMAVAIAHPGQALALDTKTLSYELINLPDSHHMAVVHSGVHRKLTDGRYKERKIECDKAREALGKQDICLLTDSEFERAKTLPEPINRRTRHCVTEHRRTAAAAKALSANDIETLGRLMNESHISMRDDFEMSVPAIDTLVGTAVDLGACGARLTGGGFGGCIVACVAKKDVAQWAEDLMRTHPDARFIC